jgi:hypothetical protein
VCAARLGREHANREGWGSCNGQGEESQMVAFVASGEGAGLSDRGQASSLMQMAADGA